MLKRLKMELHGGIDIAVLREWVSNWSKMD